MRWGLVFFFFKQKTAYEMRISDWSSDVCPSDLSKGRLLDVLVQDRRKGFGFRHFFLSSNPGDTEPAARSECSHSEIRRHKWPVKTSRTQPICSSTTTARWRGFSRSSRRRRATERRKSSRTRSAPSSRSTPCWRRSEEHTTELQ